MEENKRHIDDFLRDELGSYTETPPPAVWEELEKRLDSPTNRKGFDFRKWWWFIPALLFVAGGTFLAAHKWSQKPAVPATPTVIDTVNENESGVVPGNVYRDTATINNNTEEETRPVVKPADTPAHAQAPANATAQPTSDGSKTTNNKPAAGDNNTNTGNNKTTVASNVQQSAGATSSHKTATVKSSGKKQAKTTLPTNGAARQPVVSDNTNAANDATATTTGTGNSQPKTAGQQKKKATRKNKQQATTTAANTNTSGADATTANTNNQQAKTAKQQKPAAHKPKPATAAASSGNVAPGQDADQQTNTAQKNTTVTAAANGPKKQKTTHSAANGAKNNTAETGETNEPAKNIAARPAKTGRQKTNLQPKNETPAVIKNVPAENAEIANKPQPKKQKQTKVQQQPVAAKNTTPAVNKTAKITNNNTSVATTTKVRTQKTTKQTPAAAANTSGRHRNEAVPMQASPVKETAKTQEYTFKSKTETKETPKVKDNLDLSEKQAEAEADTAEEKEREMDPYASLNPPDDKKKSLRLEGGIKAAYTYGFSDFALNKISVLPYVQLNINTKLSVALHLGFSYGQMNKTALDGTQSYYNINPSMQTSSVLDSGGGGQLDTFYTYMYSQLRDSFSVKHTISKSVWEIELPVVFKYNLSSSVSIFAGPVFTFGKVVQISEDKSQVYSQTIKDSIVHTPNQYTIGYFNNLHQPSGAPDSTYSNAAYQNPSSTPMRIGYTAGISYNPGKRTTIDLSVQQMLTSPNFIPNETMRKVYTQPYVRLAVGFRIFK